MFRTLVKTATLEFSGQQAAVHYFRMVTIGRQRRFSAEVVLTPADRPTCEAESLPAAEAWATRLFPVMVTSRLLLNHHPEAQ